MIRIGEVPAVEFDRQAQSAVFAGLLRVAGGILVTHEAQCAVTFSGDGAGLHGENCVQLQAQDGAGVQSDLLITGKPTSSKSATTFVLTTTYPSRDPEAPGWVLRKSLRPNRDGDLTLRTTFTRGEDQLQKPKIVPAKFSAVADMLGEVRERGPGLSPQKTSPLVGKYDDSLGVIARASWAARLTGVVLQAVGEGFERAVFGADSGRILKADIDVSVDSQGQIGQNEGDLEHEIRIAALNKLTNVEAEFHFGVEPTGIEPETVTPPGETAYIRADAHYVRVSGGGRVIVDDELVQRAGHAWMHQTTVVDGSQHRNTGDRNVTAVGIVGLANIVMATLNV